MKNVLFLVLVTLLLLCDGSSIKHIIVLMEENRSFDHMFGYYNKTKVNGLTGKEKNPINVSDPSAGYITVSPTAPYVNECDPDHSTPATSFKIFGADAYHDKNFTDPIMQGFVQWENQRGLSFDDYCNVMQGFPQEKLPVLTALAENFAVMDEFYCSVPGPTWPNRLFFLSATSAGLTETGIWYHSEVGKLFPQKTIFDQVADAGGKWKLYYNDTPWELMMETYAKNPDHMYTLNNLFHDAQEGTLPDFAFINPRIGINYTAGLGSNDLHPDHDVALGEALYKDIYESLRASPQWNETLFIITFDEHGGFYDHVPTPLHVPPPGDGEQSYPDDFGFDRLGIRIPTLLISPWVEKGTVISDPPASGKPFPDSKFDLTSIMASARKLLDVLHGQPALTKRDAWSATFDSFLTTRTTPRTDCPMHLPNAPPPQKDFIHREAHMPVNSLQQDVLALHAHHAQMHVPSDLQFQHQVSDFAGHAMNVIRQKHIQWKNERAAPLFDVKLQPIGKTTHWDMSKYFGPNETTVPKYVTLATSHDGTDYCLGMLSSNVVGVSPCLPSPNATINHDVLQHWLWSMQDMTIRPQSNTSLCFTNSFEATGSEVVQLLPCVPDNVLQSYAFTGSTVAYDGNNAMVWGVSSVNFVPAP